MTEKLTKCGICKKDEKALETITLRNERYHEKCYLDAYLLNIRELARKQNNQNKKEILEIDGQFIFEYYRQHGSLEGFDTFAKYFMAMNN